LVPVSWTPALDANLAGALVRSQPGQVKMVDVAKETVEGLRKMRAGIGVPRSP